MEEGAQFAVDQINEAGGVLGRPLELKTVDMRNDVAEAAKVTQQLIDDGAAYLIGTVGDGILAEGRSRAAPACRSPPGSARRRRSSATWASARTSS